MTTGVKISGPSHHFNPVVHGLQSLSLFEVVVFLGRACGTVWKVLIAARTELLILPNRRYDVLPLIQL